MPEALIPIFRVTDAKGAASWYARLEFDVVGEHRFATGLLCICSSNATASNCIFPSTPVMLMAPSLTYLWVENVDGVAAEFDVDVRTQPWGRETELTDLDGNRVRVATATQT